MVKNLKFSLWTRPTKKSNQDEINLAICYREMTVIFIHFDSLSEIMLCIRNLGTYTFKVNLRHKTKQFERKTPFKKINIDASALFEC